MTEKNISTIIQEFDGFDELPPEIQNLIGEAQKARDKAYAPYSKFKVGAAILLKNKEIVIGSNQENASYPSGLCAERTAVYHAGAQFPEEKITAIAITAKSSERKVDSPVPPCGACRQAIAEYEIKQNQPIQIYFMGETGKVIKSPSLLNLLPLAFKFMG
jgi:cytidine deaminase